ncbi:unnamed protein product [Rotaria socialis]|uniref:Uncharacterized protein n=1 Tax=Rotaria socialis TaxID=392032 RepID=A0A820CPA5_9BILA|nr:unnamed protein product [Rotaria socialis]CAF3244469.1 unnamed protein product [Rotaria socialis]CAF3334518.1 unnamed protein product [Rotaria socialis]CAF4194305.1 unnamed protein product [Rotaria socialis]CAF4224301.1 unnamed protein product [Rotaria socialis]
MDINHTNDTAQLKVESSEISSRKLIIIISLILFTSLVIIYQSKSPTTLEVQKNHIFIHPQSYSKANCLSVSKTSAIICQWYFLNYTPSAWETVWFTNIEQLQNSVCETLANVDNLNKTVLAVERVVELQKFGRNHIESDKQIADKLLSRMFYRQECIDPKTKVSFQGAEVSQLIEPLIGLLRDPLTICDRISSVPVTGYEGAEIQSKRFFLLSIAAPFYNHSSPNTSKNSIENSLEPDKHNMNILPWMYQRSKLNLLDPELDIYTSKGQNIFIDLGSAYFDGWTGANGAASGRWFYEHYRRFGTKFDRILAYEFTALNAKTAWNQLPADVFPVYTLLNVPCAATGKFSPWVMLKEIAKPHDHVVIKLDIDTPEIEIPLMSQLLNDSSIYSLVDEVFFEHHVHVKEMNRYWVTRQGQLKDTYVLFTKLRELGVRMHSWP